jgi:hypothetical protein
MGFESQVKESSLKEGEDWFQPVLNTHTYIYTTLTPFFICVSTHKPKKNLSRKNIAGFCFPFSPLPPQQVGSTSELITCLRILVLRLCRSVNRMHVRVVQLRDHRLGGNVREMCGRIRGSRSSYPFTGVSGLCVLYRLKRFVACAGVTEQCLQKTAGD